MTTLTPTRAGTHWDTVDVKTLATLQISKTPLETIASVLERTPKAIRNMLSDARLGASSTGRSVNHELNQMIETAFTPITAAAKESGCISRISVKRSSRWSQLDKSLLTQQFAAGFPPIDIAKNLNRPLTSVLNQLRRQGLVEYDRVSRTFFTKPSAYFTKK
jgi:hypothetical protein